MNGKTPPQATEIEDVVIGGLLIDYKAKESLEYIFNFEHFYKNENKLIAKAIKSLMHQDKAIDLLTVSEVLKQNSTLDAAGGSLYLAQLSQKISSSAHIEHHYKILQQKYLQRKMITISAKYYEDSFSENCDVLELIEKAKSELDKIDEETETEQMPDINKQADSIDFDVKNYGLKSGVDKINKHFGGWFRGDLIILAGRPGMGKSSVVIQEMIQAILNDEVVVMFSLEMAYKEFLFRCASYLTGIDYGNIKKHNLNQDEKQFIYKALNFIKTKKIFIFDKKITHQQVVDLSKKIKRKHGLDRVFVDHIGLFKMPKGKNKNDAIGEITNYLKSYAKELDVPIMALSQLSRQVELRGGMKRPMLSDLRDSGEVEQDADVVVFVLRPEYYGLTEWDNEEQTSTANQIELNFAKNRNGATDRIVTNCYISTQRIGDKTFSEFEHYGQDILAHKTEIKEEPKIITATPQQAFGTDAFASLNQNNETPF